MWIIIVSSQNLRLIGPFETIDSARTWGESAALRGELGTIPDWSICSIEDPKEIKWPPQHQA